MGLLDTYLQKRLDKMTPAIADQVTKKVAKSVDKSIKRTISKAANPIDTYAQPSGLKRYQFTPDMVNGGMQSRKKPGTNISFETLRRFSISHEISRACINLRKRQISGLEWDIVPADPNDTADYTAQVKELTDWVQHLGGRGNNYRKFMDKFIEDLMVLDAVALEKQFNRGGDTHTLIPIDASTIRLMVDDTGATPEPPDPAYKQIIRGVVTAELTTEEMIYEMMNPRNDSPYGLAPLESLIVIVTSSLKAGMYNLGYLTDGNIPEGLYAMPETWQPQQIKDFQEYFDALMSGDESMTSRMKFMPPGTYTPTKKRDEMAFEQFNDWLMKITCALFEVTPMEIGFSPKGGLGGKGFSEEQGEVAEKKGILPMAKFIEEILTEVIREDLGYDKLMFQYSGLIEHDEKSVAELNEILIRSGQRTVNELRTEDGLAPIDGLDKPFVTGQITFIDQESQDAKQEAATAIQSNVQSGTPEEKVVPDKKPQTDSPADVKPSGTGSSAKRDTGSNQDRLKIINLRQEQVNELRTFKKYAMNRIKADKPIRPFESMVLPLDTVDSLNSAVVKMTTTDEIRPLFAQYIDEFELSAIDNALQARNELMA